MALVATDGTIDFLCWPDFDSPSIFAALLDPDKGGHFTLAPQMADARVVQTYLPDTNVLLTQWLSDEASVQVTDLMAGKWYVNVHTAKNPGGEIRGQALVN